MFTSLAEIAHFTVGIIEAGTFHPDDPLLAVCALFAFVLK